MFECYFFEDSSTVAILDRFEESNEKSMKLKDIVTLASLEPENVRRCNLSLLIRKTKPKDKCYLSNIRMTDIKNICKQKSIFVESLIDISELSYRNVPKMELPAYHFLYNIKADIIKGMTEIKNSNKEIKFTFDVPIELNGQNSSNRTGYGSEYCGDFCLYQGTEYGETSSYLIVGFTLKAM